MAPATASSLAKDVESELLVPWAGRKALDVAEGVQSPSEFDMRILSLALITACTSAAASSSSRVDPDCSYAETEVKMTWKRCAVTDCVVRDGSVYLTTPTSGRVVKEAHLVTVEDTFTDAWPANSKHKIDAHWAQTEAASGYTMERQEPWAPAGEGGSRFGQAAHYKPLPVEDEAWYINMYWRSRPAAGTRMLVKANGRVVVAAAGYETGPGSNTAVAGVAEEVHHYLGTGHGDVLEIGFANDPGLPLGPLDCL